MIYCYILLIPVSLLYLQLKYIFNRKIESDDRSFNQCNYLSAYVHLKGHLE